MLVSGLNQSHPLDCLVVAQVRNTWADHTSYLDHGYIRYYSGRKALLREHQYVAQIAYGLPDGYHVHHIDSNRLNNRADNLAVLTPAEHGKLHFPQSRMTVTCPVCTRQFQTFPGRIATHNVKYCSIACRGIAERKVEHPSRSRLTELMAEVKNFCELGRKFGVSDNAVRKWAKIYGLDLSVCDGRLKR